MQQDTRSRQRPSRYIENKCNRDRELWFQGARGRFHGKWRFCCTDNDVDALKDTKTERQRYLTMVTLIRSCSARLFHLKINFHRLIVFQNHDKQRTMHTYLYRGSYIERNVEKIEIIEGLVFLMLCV